ncbi:MAG: AMP-binding protein [Anaerolineae bacterium]|nr:AMP-binding protein [Anaerolineae bacterium]
MPLSATPTGLVDPSPFQLPTYSTLPRSIPACFEGIVQTYPDRLALVTDTTTWTYAELNRQANRVAHGLLALASAGSEPVALLMDTDAPMMGALMGVLKAGKFFAVLDPAAPDARLRVLLDDLQTRWIMVDRLHEEQARRLVDPPIPPPAGGAAVSPIPPLAGGDEGGIQVVTVESLLATGRDDNSNLDINPDALLAIIYTSGSTGEPKGVMRTQRTMLLRLLPTQDNPDQGEGPRVSLFTSLGFGMGLNSYLRALLNGRTLFYFDLKQQGLAALPAWLVRHRITYMRVNVSLLRQFLALLEPGQVFPALEFVQIAGEPLYRSDIDRLRPHLAPTCLIRNGYGASEIPSIANYNFPASTPLTGDMVPVGYPAPGVTVQIVDEQGEPVEPGQVGEIVAIAPIVSPGYWRKPGLTDTHFAPVPGAPDLRLYRSGDLGRWRADGMLEFVGRADSLVKIRGYRVGLPIIESTLLGLPSVKQAAVVALPDPNSDSRLVAYVVPAEPWVTATALRAALAQTLPDYMLPSTFVLLDTLPLTDTGKVDRQHLPMPSRNRPSLAVPFAPPTTAVERALSDLWADVLSLDEVGVRDPFLDLGGDSLLAAQVVAHTRHLFEVDIPLRDLFQAATVADMAGLIEQRQATSVDGRVRRLVEEVERLTDAEAEQLAAR